MVDQIFIDKLRNAGYKYTKPRRRVAEVLFDADRHLSTPEIVEEVAAIDNSVGRMSIYRTLDLFTRLGIIRPIIQQDASARYVIMTEGHHHHLVCQNCGKVVHFDDCPLDELKDRLEARFGYSIQGHLIEFFGFCPECHASTN
jgi:Fur family ferric uptake transcriptional regulator